MTKGLVIVDVQKDFCDDYPDAGLPVVGGGDVARDITEYLHMAGDEYDVIADSEDSHEEPGEHYSDTPDFVVSFPIHCPAGTTGAELHDDLDFGGRTVVSFKKGRFDAAFSAFEGRNADGTLLADWLRDAGVTDIDVVGIATDFCVKATALDGAKEGFHTTVLLDLTAAVDPEGIDAVLDEFAAAGVEIDNAF